MITDPSGLAAPETHFEIASRSVLITWALPSDDGGLTDLVYTLEMNDVNLNWVVVDQATECD
jgi:hypothetical protein